MRAYVFGLACCVLTACGTGDDDDRNAPPVGGGGGGGPVGGSSPVSTAGGSGGSGGGSGSGSSGTGITMGPTASGDSSTGLGIYAVLTGRFNDGGGGYALPITCSVRFHRPGEINPSNGIETATTFSRPFVIDAFPQSFTIMNDEIGDVVVPGDPGYISSECDVDGDNFFDDLAGAYFPSLPMVEVSVPASSIDLAVGPL